MPYGHNRSGDSGAIIDETTATLSVTTALHDGRIIALNRAAGVTCTLPTSEGSGAVFEFVAAIAASGSYIIKVGNGTDVMAGFAIGMDDDTEGQATTWGWNCETSDDTITMDGTTKGGKLGDRVRVIDFEVGTFLVECFLTQSGGSEVTPFSAGV